MAVLLFALVSSLLYQDVAEYLQQQYPETVVYALIIKVVIVYGALAFVLLQFRPEPDKGDSTQTMEDLKHSSPEEIASSPAPNDRLASLEDVTKKTTLRSRYDKVIDGDSDYEARHSSSSGDPP